MPPQGTRPPSALSRIERLAWHLHHGALDQPRLTRALIALTFPMIAIAQTILAATLGGSHSPEWPGMFIVLIGQAVAVTLPWRRASLLAAATTLTYPAGMLIGAAISPALAAQLADARTRDAFMLESWVLIAAGAGPPRAGGRARGAAPPARRAGRDRRAGGRAARPARSDRPR